MVRVRPAGPADVPALVDTLAAAFSTDPLFVWWFADAATRGERLRGMMRRLVELRLAGGEVWVADDGASGALWNPPGGLRGDPEAMETGWREFFATCTADERARGKAFEEVAQRWHPAAPHWYLGVLGTAPGRHGQGLASAAVRPVLDRCDAAGVPAYLETMNPVNVPFYERRGFRVLGEDAAPGGPPAWFMWREPAQTS